MTIDRNEVLRQALPRLYQSCARTQADIHRMFFHDLKHYAWKKVRDEADGEALANHGIFDFFQRISRHPLENEDNPSGYLYTCVKASVRKFLNRRWRFAAQLRIHEITVGFPTRIVVYDHGVSATDTFGISRSNCKPSINKNPVTPTEFRIIDRDTIEIDIRVDERGDNGRLHIPRSKPTVTSFEQPTPDGPESRYDPCDESMGPDERTEQSEDPSACFVGIDDLLSRYGHVLAPDELTVLRMRSEGRTFREIGDAIGRSADSVCKSDLPRTLDKLKKRILEGEE